MRPTASAVTDGSYSTIVEFLARDAARCANGAGIHCSLHISGHSLGGALSPALARYLIDAAVFGAAPVFAERICSIYAGADIGNAPLAALVAEDAAQLRTRRFDNARDLVPFAFSHLNAVRALWPIPAHGIGAISLNATVSAIVALVESVSQGTARAADGQWPYFMGAWNNTAITDIPSLANEILVQHVYRYFGEFDDPPVHAAPPSCHRVALPMSSSWHAHQVANLASLLAGRSFRFSN